ncbi:MAG: hypothetical protein HGA85_04610 [Nanoarchaeota archaeon]|nr:hypothetical protein [Nanoarchaeota archaeon]
MDPATMFYMNAAAGATVSALAWQNRYGILGTTPIRSFIMESAPGLSKAYEEISPTLEHAAMGFVSGCGGYAMKGLMMSPSSNGSINPDVPVGLFIGTAVTFDLLWEGYQALERKEVLPEQFIGTCAGAAVSLVVNNFSEIADIATSCGLVTDTGTAIETACVVVAGYAIKKSADAFGEYKTKQIITGKVREALVSGNYRVVSFSFF